MFIKLLKYDLKEQIKSLTPIFIVTITSIILSRIFIFLMDISAIFKTASTLIFTLSFILTLSLLFIVIGMSITKYYNKTVKDEGYLTHTLPVKKSSIILSKLTSQIILEIIAIVVSSLGICILTNSNPIDLYNLIIEILGLIAEYSPLTLILFIIVLFMSQINITLLMYAAISFGQKHSSNKKFASVVYGVVIYIISQIITVILNTPILADSSVMVELEKTLPSESVINKTMLISLGISILISLGYFFITKINLEKKLNLE